MSFFINEPRLEYVVTSETIIPRISEEGLLNLLSSSSTRNTYPRRSLVSLRRAYSFIGVCTSFDQDVDILHAIYARIISP
jgi:hypothetical protein